MRYIIAAGDWYYPQPLFRDVQGTADTISVASAIAHKYREESWVAILDTHTGAVWNVFYDKEEPEYEIVAGFPNIGQPSNPSQAFAWGDTTRGQNEKETY
jgi:hypothetical protein